MILDDEMMKDEGGMEEKDEMGEMGGMEEGMEEKEEGMEEKEDMGGEA